MPRQQDPNINFNWIDITTIFPGASTSDVEQKITDVLEDTIHAIADIKFVSSTSREGMSNILVRFKEIDTATFTEHVTSLRREISNIKNKLPPATLDPIITEITTDNSFPIATIVVSALQNNENLHRQATLIKQDLEQLGGVNKVNASIAQSELQINFNPSALEAAGINPTALAQTIRAYYRDLAFGTIKIQNNNWSVKQSGITNQVSDLANLPVLGANGEIPLSSLAEIKWGKKKERHLAHFNKNPAILFAVTKKENYNILQLVDQINNYIDHNIIRHQKSGVTVALADDQTEKTRSALRVMQNNALIGLVMVLLVTWLFVGSHIAFLTGIAIPFILAGTFWFLDSLNQTLNIPVLLGVVISLGMLVDDAVVVIEAVYYRLLRGAKTSDAVFAALQEVASPVTTAVLTTMAAFLPLMLLSGILGQYMRLVPMVVTIALAISLVEAFWLLPSHILMMSTSLNKLSQNQKIRTRIQHKIRLSYIRNLIHVMRHPYITLLLLFSLFGGTFAIVKTDKIKVDFFASDPIRLFYVSLKLPPGSTLEQTMAKAVAVEETVRTYIKPGEARAIVSYAGQIFTETEQLVGDRNGQILVSLQPRTGNMHSVSEIIESMRAAVEATPGINNISFLELTGGPPTSSDINIKVRGNDIKKIRHAVQELNSFLASQREYHDISDDDIAGKSTLELQLNKDAIRRSAINPDVVSQTLRLLIDGKVVSDFRHLGETIEVRVRSKQQSLNHIDELLNFRLSNKDGHLIPLNRLLNHQVSSSRTNIKHYNYKRSITLQANIDKNLTTIKKANNRIKVYWRKIRDNHPSITLDFTGVLDDINESIDGLVMLFLFGVGLIYLILGTQFKSYFQPFLIITTVPMAFTGVVIGLLLSNNPLSLFTLYGIVALTGIAVNAAIVLIFAANSRLDQGMGLTHATIYAARRRVIPILITSMTTIAGLFSLATGLAGHSLLWGPIATSLVWGLLVSTILTLFLIPLLYRLFMRWSYKVIT